MPAPSSSRLFKSADAFTEHHVARVVQGRDEQLRQLRLCIAPTFRASKPLHAALVGSPGSGKTLTARTVAGELDAKGLLTTYINCMKHSTLHAVLEEIITQLKTLRSERAGTAFKLEQLDHFLKGRPLVVILDEIDKVLPKERSLILYNLSVLGKIGLICIASNTKFLEALEENVRSRLAPTVITFSPYGVDELVSIVEARSREGLAAGACSSETALDLARLAAGDARTAIQCLHRAAVNAGQRGTDTIDMRDVRDGWKDGAELKRNYLLSQLNEHHRAMLCGSSRISSS